MTHKLRTMADIRRLAGEATPSASAQGATTQATGLLVTEVNGKLAAGVGDLDLGLVGNYMAQRHQRREEGKMQRALVIARVEQASRLMLEKIAGEAEIIRTHFRQDFSDRIAALAEAAVASEITVMRKLRAIEAEARNFVFRDLKRELDELQVLLAQGVLDDESFGQEAGFRLSRYERLRSDFTALIDQYQATVQNTYRGAAH